MISNINLYFKENKFFRYHFNTESFSPAMVKRLLKAIRQTPNMEEAINRMKAGFAVNAKEQYSPDAEQTWLFHYKGGKVEIQKTNYNAETDCYSRGQLLDEIEL